MSVFQLTATQSRVAIYCFLICTLFTSTLHAMERGERNSRAEKPTGIYAIDKVVDLPFVDGVVVRVSWSSAEEEEGHYDFNHIDDIVRDAMDVGQSVTIANLMQFAPEWLLERAETFEMNDDVKIVPWDTQALAAMDRYAQAQANHTVDGVPLSRHPAVKQISASILGINSLRLTDLPEGYAPGLLQQAATNSVQTWASAYPRGKHLFIGLFGVNDDGTVNGEDTAFAIRDSLLERFNGNAVPRINFFQELLTGESPNLGSDGFNIVQEVSDDTGIMYQACGEWSIQGDEWAHCNWLEPLDTPDAGFAHGFNQIGATYFEIYPEDLENDEYYSQFEHWADVLRNL